MNDNDEGTNDMSTPTTLSIAEVEQLQAQVDELTARVERQKQSLTEAVDQRRQAERAKRQLEESFRDALKERVDNDEVERDVANGLLEELGLKSLNRKFSVVVTLEVTVDGLEAEDEDDAERIAREAVEGSMGSYDFGDAEYDDVSDNVDSVSATEDC